MKIIDITLATGEVFVELVVVVAGVVLGQVSALGVVWKEVQMSVEVSLSGQKDSDGVCPCFPPRTTLNSPCLAFPTSPTSSANNILVLILIRALNAQNADCTHHRKAQEEALA
jgi:hypothetical protein